VKKQEKTQHEYFSAAVRHQLRTTPRELRRRLRQEAGLAKERAFE